MLKANKNYKLKYYDSVNSRDVDWLWYPYIPYGKITIIQGDPGDGKTTFVLNLVALLTQGKSLSQTDSEKEAIVAIYQNAEDGIEDTIKPRLESVGADCSKVAYLEYDGKPITLSDDRIEQAIVNSGAKLLVLDPLQAFMGNADMNRATDVRALMQKLAKIADRTGCAVVLVGHMNKATAGKGIYRSLGSIDLIAAARSALLVGKVKDNESVRAVVHIKSNLAPQGKPIAFELSENYEFRFIEDYEITQDELLGESASFDDGKIGNAAKIISNILKDKQVLASEVIGACKNSGLSTRTIYSAKNKLGVRSTKIDSRWVWEIESEGESFEDNRTNE
ncbi:MAG: AAA family ATPase [Firmicutes bacterium]|nr:AAA family ATPase [Bacillota bacterium]